MKVVAVIVSFQPDLEILQEELAALSGQVAHVVIVDNGSSSDISYWNANQPVPAEQVIGLPENIGIGAAQNIGIEWAKRYAADGVLLMDQDSIPQEDMVRELVAAYSGLLESGCRAAAIGCQYSMENSRLSGFVRFTGGWGNRVTVGSGEGKAAVECDFLIASGSLIALSVIDIIGKMDEGLFIDHVDTEWCLRARAKGYKLYGAYAAIMHHQLGAYVKRIWFLRWRNVSVHPPYRYYYMIRNSVLLHKRAYPDKLWRRFDIQRALQVIFFFGFCMPGRFQRLRMMVKGGFDGICGITGKMP